MRLAPRRAQKAVAVVFTAVWMASCAVVAQPDERPDYLRYVAFETPGNIHVLLRWSTDRMPLSVHLPDVPAKYFDDPEGASAIVRAAILEWTDAAGPGIPSFEFVDSRDDAEIRFLWADRSPDNVVAHCFYDVDLLTRRFGVSHVYVAARHADGTRVEGDLLRRTVVHETGHALGLGGHSPNPEDAMYWLVHGAEPGSLAARFVQANRSTGLTARDRATLRALYERPNGFPIRGARRVY